MPHPTRYWESYMYFYFIEYERNNGLSSHRVGYDDCTHSPCTFLPNSVLPYPLSRIIAEYRLLFQGEFVYCLLVRIIDWCCHCPCTIQPTILNLMTVILLFSVLQLWILFNHGAHSDYLIHVTAVKLCHFFFISDFVNLKNRFLNQKDIKKARCMGHVCLFHWYEDYRNEGLSSHCKR